MTTVMLYHVKKAAQMFAASKVDYNVLKHIKICPML